MDIVLVSPQIPQNTGSIARTAAATQTPLHLIDPLGFEISEKTVRRAGLDYWPWVPLYRHASWEAYEQRHTPKNVWLLSKRGYRPYTDVQFDPSDAIVFGAETTGLPQSITARFPTDHLLVIPMICPHVRSLNLSNSVSIVLYEALRQIRPASAAAPQIPGPQISPLS